MISWIQRTFQHHFKWLFLLLLATVIISFVFITNASSGLGHGGKQAPARPFFGVNLSSQEESKHVFEDAAISVQLHGSQMQIRSEQQFEQYALQRLAGLHLAQELNLPVPANEEIGAYVQTLGLFAPEGKFDVTRYTAFRDTLKTNPRMTEADVSRVIAEDVLYQQVLKLLSGPGYVLTADVKNQLAVSGTTWSIETADVDYTTFKPVIAVTDEALAKFYEFNPARYEVAAKVGVSYINFPATAYVSQVTVSEDGLRAYYDANKTRFPAPTVKNDKAPALLLKPAGEEPDYIAVRATVESAYRLEKAQALAAAAAADFTVAIYDAKATTANIDALIASHKLTRKSVAPFNSSNIPADFTNDPQIASKLLELNAERPFSDALTTSTGAVVLVFEKFVPSYRPPLADVKERVMADYTEAEKRKRFSEAGLAFRNAVDARIKAGDTFEKAVTAANSTIAAKVTTKTVAPFTLAAPPQDFNYSLYTALLSLQKGQLTEMIITGDKGQLVYAADKKAPAFDAAAKESVEMRKRIADFTSSRNGGAYLAQLVDAELAKTAPTKVVE